MKLSKKILAGVLGVAMVAMTSVSALAVAPGYSDYGASDEKDVVAGETLELKGRTFQSSGTNDQGWTIASTKYYTKKLKKQHVLERQGNNQKGQWKILIKI